MENTTIENGFANLDLELAVQGINQLVESIPNNNLTTYHKDNGVFTNQAQARVLSAILGSFDYQIKSLRGAISEKLSKLKEHLESNGQGTEIHEVQTESQMEYINACEVTLDSFESLFETFKAKYKDSTDETWQPYVKTEKQNKETASSLMAKELLAKYER